MPNKLFGFYNFINPLLKTKDYFMLELHKRELSVTLLLFLQGLAQKCFKLELSIITTWRPFYE
jgi:hypothetical protein